MKTVYYTAASLDGYIADTSHSLDWLFQFGEGAGDSFSRFMPRVGAAAMGSSTYEWLLRQENFLDPERAKQWPHRQPTWVFSSRELPAIPGADIRFARGDVRPVYEEMRAAAQGRDLWIIGGGELAGQFLDHGLLDEMIVTIAAVTLGGGAPLFPRAVTRPPMRLLGVRQYGGAFAELHYELPKGT